MSFRATFAVIGLGALMLAGSVVMAGDEKEPKVAREKDRVQIDFRNMTLKDLFELMEQNTGAPILYPTNLGGQTVYASGVKSMTRGQLLSIFQAILELHGHTLVSVPVWPGVVVD